MAMDYKENRETSNEAYTLHMLLNDIQDSASGCVEDSCTNGKAIREQLSKLIVMQMLVAIANEYSGANYQDDEKLRNAIDVKINNDIHLAGYIFFVSQNPQFDYSWNYLRKREDSYKEFLVEAIRFLNNVLTDMNILVKKPRIQYDVHLVMNDIIDVSLIGTVPYVKVNILWENFHQIASVKRLYNFTVKSKECILVAGKRKESADAEKLIDAALAKFNTRRKIHDEQ